MEAGRANFKDVRQLFTVAPLPSAWGGLGSSLESKLILYCATLQQLAP